MVIGDGYGCCRQKNLVISIMILTATMLMKTLNPHHLALELLERMPVDAPATRKGQTSEFDVFVVNICFCSVVFLVLCVEFITVFFVFASFCLGSIRNKCLCFFGVEECVRCLFREVLYFLNKVIGLRIWFNKNVNDFQIVRGCHVFIMFACVHDVCMCLSFFEVLNLLTTLSPKLRKICG